MECRFACCLIPVALTPLPFSDFFLATFNYFIFLVITQISHQSSFWNKLALITSTDVSSLLCFHPCTETNVPQTTENAHKPAAGDTWEWHTEISAKRGVCPPIAQSTRSGEPQG